MAPSLCLGTAQFGLDYGATNLSGQVTEKNAAIILTKAHESGINWIDTAQAYGNAEEVLGRNLTASQTFNIVTKLAPQSKMEYVCSDTEEWEKSFFESLSKLRVNHIDSFILHSANDLTKPGFNYLQEWLLSLRQRGYVRRLGLSIYNACDLDGVDANLLDIVQLPLSLYDQRLIQNGTIARLTATGTAIHARSLYLQGRILTPSDKWPNWISSKARLHHKSLELKVVNQNSSLLELALGFAKSQSSLEAVVLGVCNLGELAELINTWAKPSPWSLDDWAGWSLDDTRFLDPREWPN